LRSCFFNTLNRKIPLLFPQPGINLLELVRPLTTHQRRSHVHTT